MKTFVLLLALFSSGPHWIRIKDAYRIHRVWVTGYGNWIGDYYQPPYKDAPFTAQCAWHGKPVEFPTEAAARAYVLEHCTF